MRTVVTQDLKVRIVPVNNPHKFNEYGEQQGFYRAYVSHSDFHFATAERETMRGIVPSTVGYGHAANAVAAAEHAMGDYVVKFGALCITDTDDAA